MKFTLGWLKQHLETSAGLGEITTALTALGLEVETVEDRAAIYAPFAVAHVVSAEKHPDADRLKCLIVDTGAENLKVVCGAPNARAGMKGIFAPAGSVIPGTGAVLKKGNIRGQESNGMMVSEREMALSDESEGIIEVGGDVPVGTPMATLYRLDDPVIAIGLTPNRGDCAGVRGIARDLAAAGLGTLKPLDENAVKGAFKSSVDVRLETPDCPHFIGRYIRGVKNGPSPQWLQDRLKAVGQKPISALVDITNYMSHDLCRPLHVYDADKIKNGLHVRATRDGEKLTALNDKEYVLDNTMVAVCDDSGVLGLGGVIGGVSTGVLEETANVFVEAAYFAPLSIARTGRRLQINSDARYRFERGIDPAFTQIGMEIATRLILELCGGQVSEIVQAGAAPEWRRTIEHDPAFVEKLTGAGATEKEQATILSALGFTVEDSKTPWRVQPPSWRGDIEGAPDLVEEIVRVRGLDKIPAVSLQKSSILTQSAEIPAFTRARLARTALSARGFDETVTWSFMDSRVATHFGAGEQKQAAAMTLANPISSELDFMRPSILPNLLAASQRNNARGLKNGALCEIGPVFQSPRADGYHQCAAGIRAGQNLGRHWAGADSARPVDVFDVKADVLAVLAQCGGLGQPQLSRDAPAYYHPGRSGVFRLGKTVLAWFGEIHPAILETMGVEGPVAAFEVFLDALPERKKKSGTARPLLALSTFQPVSRDFAFIVEHGMEADSILRAARGADKNLIEDVSLFDVYQGKGVEPGHKSVAIAVTLQPREQTLTEAEIEAVSARIIQAVGEKTGGVLRG